MTFRFLFLLRIVEKSPIIFEVHDARGYWWSDMTRGWQNVSNFMTMIRISIRSLPATAWSCLDLERKKRVNLCVELNTPGCPIICAKHACAVWSADLMPSFVSRNRRECLTRWWYRMEHLFSSSNIMMWWSGKSATSRRQQWSVCLSCNPDDCLREMCCVDGNCDPISSPSRNFVPKVDLFTLQTAREH